MKKIQPYIITKSESKVLAKAVIRLFRHWNISQHIQCSLLGLALSNRTKLYSMEKGLTGIPLGQDSYERVRYLLSIHKYLRILYPENPKLLYGWVNIRNQKFSGRTPLEVMTEDGYLGLAKINQYLAISIQH